MNQEKLPNQHVDVTAEMYLNYNVKRRRPEDDSGMQQQKIELAKNSCF
jgi:ABC-type dipeptide/oligopeptide/nickel transport system ATPase subunit